ncbi:MAG: hypothetical protein ACOY31_06905 [Bacillota bacterium]
MKKFIVKLLREERAEIPGWVIIIAITAVIAVGVGIVFKDKIKGAVDTGGSKLDEAKSFTY